jgi:2-amino-4-hydroxy-6-hydroxymethyldihydropteridine diphosphokinase
MKNIFLGLGSDSGDRIGNLAKARSLLTLSFGKIARASSIYETEPWGFKSDTKFLNQIIEIESGSGCPDLLDEVIRIETTMGRKRSGSGYESRVIDIDILFYGDEIINKEALAIPHPHLHERMFVLVPLNEIAPGFVHPVLNKPVRELLEICRDKGVVNLFKVD